MSLPPRKKRATSHLELVRGRPETPAKGFIGRRQELREMQASLAAAGAGEGQLFVLCGEPGIGKTRLAAEVAALAPEEMSVHWGRCWDGMDAPTLWPWLEVFRSILRGRSSDEIAAVAGTVADDLATLLPELRSALPGARDVPDLGPEGNQFRLLEVGLELLRNVAREGPLLVLLDDLHAADATSLRLLVFVARALPSLPLVVLATARDVEARMTPAAAEMMPQILREGTRLPIRGLAATDVSLLVRQRAGFEPRPSVVETLESSTGGNPFLLDETVRLLLAENRLRAGQPLVGSTPLPEGARHVLQRRFALLSDEHHDVLKHAAVIGRNFEAEVLRHVAAADEAQVFEALRRAEDVALLVRSEKDGSRYVFAHDLVMEALLAECDPAWTARIHLQVGERLEATHSRDPEPFVPEIARHFLAAIPAGSGDRALHYTTRAARQAIEASREEEGARWASRALECLAAVGGSDAQRGELMLQLGVAQRWTGQVEEGRRTLTEVTKLAEAAGDEVLFAQAAIAVAETRKETGLVDREIIGILERALELLGSKNAGLRAHVLGRLATALYFDERWQEGPGLTEEAVALARPTGDSRVLGYVLAARQLALWRPDTLEERLALSEDSIRFAEQSAHLPTIFEARNWRIVGLLETGQMLAVDAEIEELSRRFQQMRYARALGYVRLFRTMRDLMRGRFDTSEAEIAKILEEANRNPNEDGLLQYAGSQLYFLSLERGRIGELEGTVRFLADQFPVLKSWRAGLAQVLLETGRADEARAEIDLLAPSGFEAVRRDGNWITAMAVFGEVAARLGATDHAARLYEHLLPYRHRNVVVALGTHCYGSVSRYLGVLAQALGRRDDARAHLRAGIEADRAIEGLPFVAWGNLHLSEVLERSGDAADAERGRAHRREAIQTAEALGMVRLLERLEGGAQASATAAPVASHDDGLPVVRMSFQRTGDVWLVGPSEAPVQIRHSRGLEHLRRLLSRPSEEIAAVELQSDGKAVEVDESNDDALLDARARSELRGRVRSLRAEMDEAAANNDVERASRLNAELEEIEEFVRSATGLGGRDRGHGGSAERARVNVTRTIRGALRNIARADAMLADLLNRSIRTGRLCSYEPDPARPIVWEL